MRKIYYSLYCLFCFFNSGTACAANIGFTATVMNSTCDLSLSPSGTIPFGDVNLDDIKTEKVTVKNIVATLSNCVGADPGSNNTPSVKISGSTLSSQDDNLFKSGGTSNNVGIVVSNDQGVALKDWLRNGDKVKFNSVNWSNPGYNGSQLNFYATLACPAATCNASTTGGTVTATIVFDFVFS